MRLVYHRKKLNVKLNQKCSPWYLSLKTANGKLCLQLLFGCRQCPPSIKYKAPQYCLSSIHAHLPVLLSVMCRHWCFLFRFGFPSTWATFPYKCVPEEIHNCCVARHAIYLCYMAKKKRTGPPVAFIREQTWVKHLLKFVAFVCQTWNAKLVDFTTSK